MISLLAGSSALAAPLRQLSKEPLETYEDPPRLIFRTGVSPAMISQHGGFISYQVNVDASGQNITGDAANEPSIAVDPTDHNKMAIGWRQFNSSASNFRQSGYAYSTTGGTSWNFRGVLENNVFRSDPVLKSDDTGNFFYLSLLENFFDDIWRSVNGGFSWARLGPATGGDKQWFTIDNTNSSGHGFQYQSWSTAGNNYNGRQFSRSTNGGATWLNPVALPASPVWGTLDVDAEGNLFLAGVNFDSKQIWSLRSSNAKQAASIPSFDIVAPVDMGGTVSSSTFINPEGLVGQVNVVADRSGTAARNNVYLMASLLPAQAVNGADVMFIRSTDSGQTFSAPQRINDDAIDQSHVHWLASLSAAPNGRLDAVWLDTRNSTNGIDSQLFYSYSLDAGSNWSTNIAVSEQFDPSIGYPNQNKLGDYITSVSDDGGADVAYPATFNGEEDVYYVRVTPVLASQLLNISSRAPVRTGEEVVIAGFIINGAEPKKVIIRGRGPTVTGAGASLADPTLELHQGDATLATNDNWKIRSDGTSQQAEVEATTLPPSNDLESAIVTTLPPGQYTAILAGKNGGIGAGLVEVFDLQRTSNSKLANISTRAVVDTDNGILIGGFIIDGGAGGGQRVIARAIGPSLASSQIQNALQDPTLELHDANGVLIATNDNWKINDQTGQSQEAEVRATTLPPSDDRESAIVANLAPGPHTAIVRGKNRSTGIGLVDVFGL